VAAVTPAALGAMAIAILAEGPARGLGLLVLLAAALTWVWARHHLAAPSAAPAPALADLPTPPVEETPWSACWSVLASLPHAVVLTTPSGTIEAVTPAVEALFHHPAEDLAGQSIRLLLPSLLDNADGQRIADRAAAIAAMGAHGEEGYGLRGDYQPVPVRCTCAAIQVHAQPRLAWVIADLTPESALDDALDALDAEVDKAVAARLLELEHEALLHRQAEFEARRANEARSQFLANMSHELRTPLNAIIGYAELIEEEAEETGTEHILPDLQRIQQAAHHQLVLINDVLDLNRIDAGHLDITCEEIDVATLTGDVLATVRPLADKTGTRLDVCVEADATHLTSDPLRLRQALYNLLSNACKFTEGGHILLHVAVTHQTNVPHIAFEVIDNGIGIDADRLDRVFEPFVQEDGSATRRFGGTGLGLSLTRSLARLMGGDVLAESEKGRGSTFTLLLPLTRAEAAPPSPHSETTAALAMAERLSAHDMARVASARRAARRSGSLLTRAGHERTETRATLDESLRAITLRPKQVWDESTRPTTDSLIRLRRSATPAQTGENEAPSRSTGTMRAASRKDLP